MNLSFPVKRGIAPGALSRLLRALPMTGLLLLAATAQPASAQGAASIDYCFRSPGGEQECFPGRAEAEAKMRASTLVGEYLKKVDEYASGTPEWRYEQYEATQKVGPEIKGTAGYQIGGWGTTELGCVPSSGNGPGPEHCASEQELVSLWIARRSAFLSSGNCEYRKHAVVGVHDIPSGLAGAYSGARAGAAVFGHGPTQGGRYIDEEWWCPGWGTPESVKSATQISKTEPFTCPAGFIITNPASDWPIVCSPTDNRRELVVRVRQVETPKGNCNPCYPATGEKQRHETDFEFAGEGFTRTYRSLGMFSQGRLGDHWNHSQGSMVGGTNSYQPYLINDDGSYLRMEWVSEVAGITSYRARGLSDLAVRVVSGYYEVIDSRGNTRFYSAANGRLMRRRHASDPARDLIYAYDSDGLLSEVVDGTGRKLSFHYTALPISRAVGGELLQIDRSKRLTEVVLPDGAIYEYSYDAFGNLDEVTRPDGSSRQYHYNEAAHVGVASPHLMTGISDDGVRYATFTYDAYGRVTSSTLAGNVERTALNYVSENVVDVTTPSGLVRRHTYAPGLQRRLLSVSDSLGTVRSVYDAADRRIESIDRAGRRTLYTHTNGFVASITSAPDTALERVMSFGRDGSGRITGTLISSKPAGNLLPVLRNATAYDPEGRPRASCQVDPNGSNPSYECGSSADGPTGVLQSTYAYCSAADAAMVGGTCPLAGLLRSIDGPLPGSADSVRYDYRASEDLSGCASASAGNCHRKGDLWKVTDATGQATEVLRFDLAGRATLVRDANGVVTSIGYDVLGRLATQTSLGPDSGSSADDATTTITYGVAGLVDRMTQPDGAYVQFGYDAAHRLTRVQDGLGNVIEYDLDAAGNRFTEETRDGSGTLKRTLSRLFDQLGRVETLVGASANATEFTYDLAGNMDTATDSLGRTTDHDYDALGRLRESIANVGGTGEQRAQTRFEYDALDRLTAVTDPKGLATQYRYDAFGRLLQLTSPDTGIATYTYDSAGNRVGQVDARGVQTGYEYDAANRLALIRTVSSQPGGGNVLAAFTYDSTPGLCGTNQTFSAGRLSAFTDPSGGTTYCHDRRGNVVRKVQRNSGGQDRSLTYSYTAADRISSISYPSGLQVTYTRNAAGQVTGVSARSSEAAASVNLVTAADYQPFGPIKRLVFGNGRVLDKNRDLDYGITSVADSAATGLAIGYTLDDVGNVVALAERQNGGATAARTVAYDGLDRLTALKNGTATVQSFTYDATGNRTKKVSGGSATYVYGTDSHRLTKVGTVTRSYDAAGNSTAIGTRTYAYDDLGRMASVSTGTTLTRSYRYNALGQRVAKIHPTTATSTVFYVYDEAGKLMGEYKPNGTLIREYIWLDNTLVATRATHAGQAFQYVLTDHLDTPRAVVLPSTNAIVWRWDLTGSAFGEHAALNNPDGDTTTYTFNLRYPGQYFDSETGLHYNYFRDYEPGTGRYVQSDPIGLGGGISTYGYVRGRPFGYVDPLGLWDLATEDYSLPQGLVDIAAGVGDGLTGDVTSWIRDRAGITGGVDTCSNSYIGGKWGGIGLSFAVPVSRAAYVAKVSQLPRSGLSAAEVVSTRNALKAYFRGRPLDTLLPMISPRYGYPTLPQLLAKNGDSIADVISRSGGTSAAWSTVLLGGGSAKSGASVGAELNRGCGCD